MPIKRHWQKEHIAIIEGASEEHLRFLRAYRSRCMNIRRTSNQTKPPGLPPGGFFMSTRRGNRHGFPNGLPDPAACKVWASGLAGVVAATAGAALSQYADIDIPDDVLAYGVTADSSATAYMVPPAARDIIVHADKVVRGIGGGVKM